MAVVEIGDVGTFDVWQWTAGDGPPLVFLHGYERHPGAAPFLQRLAESHRVLAPELPGYGTSSGFEHIVDLTDLVLQQRTVIERWTDGPVDLIGHSLGGMVAAELAALSPHLVRRLVLVDAFGLWRDDEPSVDPFGAADVAIAATWHGTPPSDPPTNFVPSEDPYGALMFQMRNLATATKFLWPIPDRGLRRRLPYITARTLVVQGAADGLVPRSYGEEIARLVPNARLAVIDAAGHYPMIERPDEFNQVVEAFLTEETGA